MVRVLLVASPGGHIDELFEFAPQFADPSDDVLWLTARTPQTVGLLDGQNVEWVPPVASRQAGRAAASLPRALSLLRRVRPDRVVSTGAALATPYLLAAAALRREIHYVESATRLSGTSMTGRIAERLPGTRLHHQGLEPPSPRWRHIASVFDGFRSGPVQERPVRRVVVVLGSERYPFRRAVDQVLDALPPDLENLLVQSGHTDLPPDVPHRPWVDARELHLAIAGADLVVAHAGVGTVLSAFRSGKHPVVLPRHPDLGEHIDDHQLQLAASLAERGLVTVGQPGDHLAPLFASAACQSVQRR